MYQANWVVRVVYNSGRTTESEFSMKLAAQGHANVMRDLVEKEGMGKVYLYQRHNMPEDLAVKVAKRWLEKNAIAIERRVGGVR